MYWKGTGITIGQFSWVLQISVHISYFKNIMISNRRIRHIFSTTIPHSLIRVNSKLSVRPLNLPSLPPSWPARAAGWQSQLSCCLTSTAAWLQSWPWCCLRGVCTFFLSSYEFPPHSLAFFPIPMTCSDIIAVEHTDRTLNQY